MSYVTKTGGEPRIIRAKGVRFNYLQFLWSRLNAIQSIAESGDFATALKLLILDIPIFPEDIRKAFEQKAKVIENGINIILSYQIPQLQNIPDLFIKQWLREKYLAYYCQEHYKEFITALFEALQDKGYIEKGDYSLLEGQSHTLRTEEEEIAVEEILKGDFEGIEEEG